MTCFSTLGVLQSLRGYGMNYFSKFELQHRFGVALVAGLASAILGGVYAYVLVAYGLTAYADRSLAYVDEVFWKCGSEFGACQATLLDQAANAQLLRRFANQYSLTSAGFSAGLLLLVVPAVILGISNKKSPQPRIPMPRGSIPGSDRRMELAKRLRELDELKSRGEIDEAVYRKRRSDLIKNNRQTRLGS